MGAWNPATPPALMHIISPFLSGISLSLCPPGLRFPLPSWPKLLALVEKVTPQGVISVTGRGWDKGCFSPGLLPAFVPSHPKPVFSNKPCAQVSFALDSGAWSRPGSPRAGSGKAG